jgi:pSer/pThr/pTyr-binding forkhead associated (FHA) protein
MVDAAKVRFHRPPEGTLQLLPGRLDVVGGDPSRGVIRFVKIPQEEPEVTFGRASGPQYRHIQLKIPTVSRMHARMRFLDGVWWIENLSTTNPVVVNGQDLRSGDGSRTALADGDRIEMGEIVFRYWI